MNTKKKTGSFYTPPVIAEFVVKRVLAKNNSSKLDILEPSAGDGVFVKTVYDIADVLNISNFTVVEKNKEEAEKLAKIDGAVNLAIYDEDFLGVQEFFESGAFNIVLGNPPYIKNTLLTSYQIDKCKKIHLSFPNLARNSIKNIWSAFLVRSISLLDKNEGILSFVLPAELLQVNYAKELRELLLIEFERVEIFTFNELLFKECKGQDTLILIAERKSYEKGLFFCNINKVEDLFKNDFHFSIKEDYENTKWTSHALSSKEIKLLDRLRKKLKPIDYYCTSKAGIVTAANNFFIVNQNTIDSYSLEPYVKPIIQKSSLVSQVVVFNEHDLKSLIEKSIPSFLIDLNSVKLRSNSRVRKYLQKGLDEKLDLRFKMKIRKNWYEVPGISEPAQALFFKRCSNFPKFVRNDASVFATDSAYVVSTRVGYDITSLIFSFYNSLTLIFSELNGRYYGGGVLELTPNEFKNLPIPYLEITQGDFESLIFKMSGSIPVVDDFFKDLDFFILKKAIPDITDEEIFQLSAIRKKLSSRRMGL